ncbi:Uncharacterised protein [Yersinia pseudotuberculosis]|uniref:Uncharacterized protein n=1 Tax=Yersinia pseudotuberculosis TaxID=633 RepID=A0A380Q7V1_YERPU|nr:Uncharacterised protein [Yersinia pseudotuberculosis]
MDNKPYFNHGHNGVASTNFGTDLQTKSITSLFIDNIFQDTWLLALAIRNRPGVTVDNALYQYCENMIEQVQKKLRSAGHLMFLPMKLSSLIAYFWMKPLRELHPEPKDKINTTAQFLFYPMKTLGSRQSPYIARCYHLSSAM